MIEQGIDPTSLKDYHYHKNDISQRVDNENAPNAPFGTRKGLPDCFLNVAKDTFSWRFLTVGKATLFTAGFFKNRQVFYWHLAHNFSIFPT